MDKKFKKLENDIGILQVKNLILLNNPLENQHSEAKSRRENNILD